MSQGSKSIQPPTEEQILWLYKKCKLRERWKPKIEAKRMELLAIKMILMHPKKFFDWRKKSPFEIASTASRYPLHSKTMKYLLPAAKSSNFIHAISYRLSSSHANASATNSTRYISFMLLNYFLHGFTLERRGKLVRWIFGSYYIECIEYWKHANTDFMFFETASFSVYSSS